MMTIEAIGDRRKHITALGKAATDAGTIVSAIATKLVRAKATSEVLEKGMRLVEAFHTSDAAATRFLASRNPADAAAAGSELGAMRRALEGVKADTSENRRIQRFIQAIVEPIDQFEQALSGIVVATDRVGAAAALRERAGGALLHAASAMYAETLAEQKDAVGAMQAAVTSSRNLGLITSAVALAIGVGLAWLIGSGISAPIARITASMRQLAEGNLDADVPHAERRDEIGAMARAVKVFRDGLARANRLAAEQASEHSLQAQRTQLLTALNAGFEAKISRMVESLSAAAVTMNATAAHMSQTAEQTKQRSLAVAGAAEQASVNVSTAADGCRSSTTSLMSVPPRSARAGGAATARRRSARDRLRWRRLQGTTYAPARPRTRPRAQER
jgi:HAMP domain-containing protein